MADKADNIKNAEAPTASTEHVEIKDVRNPALVHAKLQQKPNPLTYRMFKVRRVNMIGFLTQESPNMLTLTTSFTCVSPSQRSIHASTVTMAR
jgi:uncharacterized metal-binding protein YceD (DUF177 family)